MSITVNGTTGLNFPDGTSQPTAGYVPFRNKIINGDMRIDQRNNGNSISVPTGTSQIFPVDRWRCQNIAGSSTTYTAQRVTDAPPGFVNSLRITTATSGAVNAGDSKHIWIPLEGYNVADLAFGTSAAKTITLSFWTKSSLTGNFGGAISSDGAERAYSFLYAISQANTWEYKTVTIAGDTTAGGWNKDTSSGMRVNFNIGSGASYIRNPGSWGVAGDRGATGQVSLLATSAATWQITGVQLEAGSAATSFEHRPIGTELALCQRYYEEIWCLWATAWAAGMNNFGSGSYKVNKRAAPTLTVYADSIPYAKTGTVGAVYNQTNAAVITGATPTGDSSNTNFCIDYNTGSVNARNMRATVTANAEL
jgi:hypothetical protein